MSDRTKLEFDTQTVSHLFEFCKLHRLGLADVDDQSAVLPDDFGFHLTILNSKIGNLAFQPLRREIGPLVLQPDCFDMFGPNNDLLVIRIRQNQELERLFEHYRTTFGHVSEYMPFRPHVTIRGSTQGDRDRLNSLPLPSFEFRAIRLIQRIKLE